MGRKDRIRAEHQAQDFDEKVRRLLTEELDEVDWFHQHIQAQTYEVHDAHEVLTAIIAGLYAHMCLELDPHDVAPIVDEVIGEVLTLSQTHPVIVVTRTGKIEGHARTNCALMDDQKPAGHGPNGGEYWRWYERCKARAEEDADDLMYEEAHPPA